MTSSFSLRPTGRVFVTDEDGVLVRRDVHLPAWSDAIWTEAATSDGSLFSVSDHEDYTLPAIEFFPDDDISEFATTIEATRPTPDDEERAALAQYGRVDI
jgi:hypothetical protein